jgi:hypothetical protein
MRKTLRLIIVAGAIVGHVESPHERANAGLRTRVRFQSLAV